jgi:hypothetical protein
MDHCKMRCMVCQRPGSLAAHPDYNLEIDHDHELGPSAVRGLVCPSCNAMLGVVDRGQREPSERQFAYLSRPFYAVIGKTVRCPDTCYSRAHGWLGDIPRRQSERKGKPQPKPPRGAMRYDDDCPPLLTYMTVELAQSMGWLTKYPFLYRQRNKAWSVWRHAIQRADWVDDHEPLYDGTAVESWAKGRKS